jgi:MoaA/NifB/PqqE/SkfB family radical SAM enzyme
MVGPLEAGRRLRGRLTHHLESLPILALSVHSACNCRCVMCDIWKANRDKREISAADLERHVADLRALSVQRVMLTGGEPLLHSNLWALCARLREEHIHITLVTTGLLVARHVDDIAGYVDELVVSVDGAPDLHDRIRRTRDGFDRIGHGLRLLHNYARRPRITVRSVVQRDNHARLVQTVEAIHGLDVDRLSFLAADVSSTAFNRAEPWDEVRRSEIALSRDQLITLAAAIREVRDRCRDAVDSGFLFGGLASLWRIYDYYCAVQGLRTFPAVRCNAPWVSAVLEPGGQMRPCFFHAPYASVAGQSLQEIVNAPAAVAFRRALDTRTDETCRRCVCTLSLPSWADA